MSIAGTEALAGLQRLVAVAKADSELTPAERAIIAEALEDASRNDERPESPRPGVKRRTASAFFPFAEPRSSGSSSSRLDRLRPSNEFRTVRRSSPCRHSPVA